MHVLLGNCRSLVLEELVNSPNMIALNRARTTFQRVSDAKFFNGWVRRMTPDAVLVQAVINTPIEPGQEFSFQVFGNKKNAVFRATLAVANAIGSALVVGSASRNGARYDLEFHVTSKVQFTDSTELPRFNVDGVTADIARADGYQARGATVLDVGPEGLAVLTDGKLKKSDQLAVALYGYGILLEFSAEVRNCVPIGDMPDFQRTGMQIRNIDRLNAARWKQLYTEIVVGNRAHWAPEAAELTAPAKPKF